MHQVSAEVHLGMNGNNNGFHFVNMEKQRK